MFQSFLSWMLLGMYYEHNAENVQNLVSILLIVDVTWDESLKPLLLAVIQGFNPSYRGCYLG